MMFLLTLQLKTAAIKSGGGFDCEVNIPKENYNKFFNAKENEDIVVNAVGSFSEDKKAIQLYLKTKESTPENLAGRGKSLR